MANQIHQESKSIKDQEIFFEEALVVGLTTVLKISIANHASLCARTNLMDRARDKALIKQDQRGEKTKSALFHHEGSTRCRPL
jgi:hypothetical protein